MSQAITFGAPTAFASIICIIPGRAKEALRKLQSIPVWFFKNKYDSTKVSNPLAVVGGPVGFQSVFVARTGSEIGAYSSTRVSELIWCWLGY